MKFLSKRSQGWLVIQFREDGWHWCCQIPGLPLQQGKSLQSIPAAAQVETLLLLPGERVSLISITQPGLTREAARWALEPLLLEDIDTQHIVTLQRKGDQHIVATVDTLWLEEMLGILAQAGRVPQRVLPDTIALAPDTRLRQGSQWLIRLPDGGGFHLPASAMKNFPALLAISEVSEEPLVLLANRARAENGNLLQGAFAVKRALRLPLLALGTAAALTIMSVIGAPLWEGWQAQRALAQLNQQVLERYQRYFPQETPAHPRLQLSRKAAQSDTPQGELTFISLLRQSEVALATFKENPVQTLNWDLKTRRMTLLFRDPLTGNPARSLPETLRAEVRGKKLIMEKQL